MLAMPTGTRRGEPAAAAAFEIAEAAYPDASARTAYSRAASRIWLVVALAARGAGGTGSLVRGRQRRPSCLGRFPCFDLMAGQQPLSVSTLPAGKAYLLHTSADPNGPTVFGVVSGIP
jgi:hypothetical protein